MNDNKKPRQLNVRISESDYEKIEHERKIIHKSQSGFISHIVKNGINEIIEVTNPQLRQDISKIENMLASFGNNLNQIAKALNSQSKPPMDILETMDRLDRNIVRLISGLDNLKKEKLNVVGKS